MRLLAVSMLGILLLTSCSRYKSANNVVTGTITYKSQPVNGATLLLHPAAGEGSPISILVNQDGTFRGTDVPAGDYKIVVKGSVGGGEHATKNIPPEKAAQAKEMLDKMKTNPTISFPDKYKKPESTDLKRTIGKGNENLVLELTD